MLTKWLLDPSLAVPIRLTRTQSTPEAEQEHADNDGLLASGATPIIMSDVFALTMISLMNVPFIPLLLLWLMNSCPCLLYLRTSLTEHF